MDLAKKLQLKDGQSLARAGTPSWVSDALPATSSGAGSVPEALLVFVTDRAELEAHRGRIVESASADHLTWVAYPKAGQLGTDLNRDSLAAALTASGLQPVRQIAIDDVWSALRFRPGV